MCVCVSVYANTHTLVSVVMGDSVSVHNNISLSLWRLICVDMCYLRQFFSVFTCLLVGASVCMSVCLCVTQLPD